MMAVAIRHSGNLTGALEVFEELRGLTEGVMPKSDQFLIKMRAQHGIYLYENNQLQESMQPLNEAVEWAEAAGKTKLGEVILARRYKAMNLSDLGFLEEALFQHLEATRDLEEVFG